MNRTELFLDKYKQLEEAISSQLGFEDNGTQIFRLEKLPRFKAFAADLRYCREVRNLLQHNPKIGGEYAVVPGENMIRLLDTLLEKVNRPARCGAAAVPKEKLLWCRPEDFVLPVMREMQRQDISKVPILTNGRVSGVFSTDAVFQHILENPPIQLDESTCFHHFSRQISIDGETGKYYAFVSADAPLTQVERIFEDAHRRHVRIRIVFVTQNGSPNEKLIGIITPWEMIDIL